MRLKSLLATGAITLALVPALDAHVLWINATPSEEGGRRVITSIGYGNIMPSDEILVPEWGPIDLAAYDVIAPDGVRASLGVPKLAPTTQNLLASGAQWQDAGDMGMRKLTLGDATASGTYQIIALTPVVPITHYRDASGEEHYSDKPVREIKGLAKVIDTRLEVNYMKAAFAVDRWTEIAPVGHALEIVPLSDLHVARPGDVVRFKVLLNGKPLTADIVDYPFVVATSPGFGERWSLHSELEDGEGEFRLPSSGSWRIDVRFGGPASAVAEFKDRPAGTTVWLETSFTFYLKP